MLYVDKLLLQGILKTTPWGQQEYRFLIKILGIGCGNVVWCPKDAFNTRIPKRLTNIGFRTWLSYLSDSLNNLFEIPFPTSSPYPILTSTASKAKPRKKNGPYSNYHILKRTLIVLFCAPELNTPFGLLNISRYIRNQFFVVWSEIWIPLPSGGRLWDLLQ